MPLDYASIHCQVERFVEVHNRQFHSRAQETISVLQALRKTESCMDAVLASVLNAVKENPHLRVAVPVQAPLDKSCPAPTLPDNFKLVAVDGSQITPDFHSSLPYGLVNVAGFCYPYCHEQMPRVERKSELIDVSIDEAGGFEEAINAQRDFQERLFLAEISSKSTMPTVALLDGGIEIWSEKRLSVTERYSRWLYLHMQGLKQMRDSGAAMAGYIDQPLASPVMRMLSIAIQSRVISLDQYHLQTFISVTDQTVFGKLLEAGERSQIFKLFSPSNDRYTGIFAIHFFYFNAGTKQFPEIARIEIPEWVASNSKLLNRLHAALADQCRLVADFYYPYALARAHEEAVVRSSDRQMIDDLVNGFMIEKGIPITRNSAKRIFKQIM